MRRFGLGKLAVVVLAVGLTLGAAPAAPSYNAVERSIGKIRADWAKPGAAAQPNAPGWNALFDSALAELRAYSSATNDRDRLLALNSVYQVSVALGSVGWGPAADLRQAIRDWLRPRVRLAWAERRLVEKVQSLPPVSDPAVLGNRDRWVAFVNNDLGKALQKYDGAATVAERQSALNSVIGGLDSLRTRNQTNPWTPSIELQTALHDLCDQPNVDISIDAPTLSQFLAREIVTTGPVYRKGYTSQVTAGAYLGFGLVPSDDGIAFFNRQALSSITPIWDFQNQLVSDQRGKRAAKMYQFCVNSTDSSEMTVTAVIRTNGLAIYPQQTHNVGILLNSVPQAGGGLGRMVAGLVGFNQERINQMVRDNAIGPMRENVVKEAAEEAGERIAAETARENVRISKYLIGDNRLAIDDTGKLGLGILVEQLSLRSRPENALVGGKVQVKNAPLQAGADFPQPASLLVPNPGVSADLHIGSILSNFSQGLIQSERVQKVQNVLLELRKTPPGTPLREGVKVLENLDYAGFFKAIEDARKVDPKTVVVRLKRPTRGPDFAVDARGNLVVLVNDFQVEVSALQGLQPVRISSPQAEFVVTLTPVQKPVGETTAITGHVIAFDPGPNAKIVSITPNEAESTPVVGFRSTLVKNGVTFALRGQPFPIPINNIKVRGFGIHSITPLDPSGWVRVALQKEPTAQVAQSR